MADYWVAAGSEVSPERAAWAVAMSGRFVDHFTSLLAGPAPNSG